MNYGEKIRNLRKNKGCSQEELANELNISRQSVSLWENNQSQPTIDNLRSIAAIFDVTLDSVVGEGEIKSNINNDLEEQTIKYRETKKSIYWEKYYNLGFFRTQAFMLLLMWTIVSFFASLSGRYNQIEAFLFISCVITAIAAYFTLPHYIIKNLNKDILDEQVIKIVLSSDQIIIKEKNEDDAFKHNGFSYFIEKPEYFGLVLYRSPKDKRRLYIPKYATDEVNKQYIRTKLNKRNLLGVRILK